MTNSLKVILNFHICHITLNYYGNETGFDNYEAFCKYMKNYLDSDYYVNNLPKNLRRYIHDINCELDTIFGFGASGIEYIVEFFLAENWITYKKIIKPLMYMYDSTTYKSITDN